MENKRILLAAEYSLLEPLALYHLSSIAKQEGWEAKIVMSKGPDYTELDDALREFNPCFLGFTLYTGNHIQAGRYFKKVKSRYPNLKVIIGGPHPTYFPKESLEIADFAVVGEGFEPLRRILKKEVSGGIVHLKKQEPFPQAERVSFYEDSRVHRDNAIKNVVTNTGCPFRCAYCYNSNTIDDIKGLSQEQKQEMKSTLGSERFFPLVQRPVDDVIEEIDDIQKTAPKTKFIFFEDDIFGRDIKWLEEFVEKYKSRMPFHANMRFEFINPENPNGKRMLQLLKKANCTGLSLGVESGNTIVCKEVLNRFTSHKNIFDSMDYLKDLGFKVRTYQIMGLPYGATKTTTKVNLDIDLETLELNVKLKERTGLPTFSWASTLTPYPGTKISDYCIKHGFFDGDFDEIAAEETYRILSVLRHVSEWVGPSLSPESDAWLSQEGQETYRNQLNLMMNYFPIFAAIPKGHEFARNFLNQEDTSPQRLISEAKGNCSIPGFNDFAESILKDQDLSAAKLNKELRTFVYDNVLFL